MKIEDFRVGNFVQFNHHEVGLITGLQSFIGANDRVAINSRLDVFYPVDRIMSIPLDLAWFIKLGFKEDKLCGVYRKTNYVVEVWPQGYRLRYKGTVVFKILKYVHTLQNIEQSLSISND